MAHYNKIVALALSLPLLFTISACSKDESNPDVRDLPPAVQPTDNPSTISTPSMSDTPEALPTASYNPVQTPKPKPKATKTAPKQKEVITISKNQLSKEPLPKDVDPQFYKLFYQSMKQEDPVPAWLSSNYILRFVRNKDGIDIYTTFDIGSNKAKALAEDMCNKANTYGMYENIPSLVGPTVVYDGHREEIATCG